MAEKEGVIMLMQRDQLIINGLEDFHVMTSKQITELYFPETSYRFAATRIKYMFEQKWIKQTVSTIDKCFAYYVENKPAQIHHDLIRAEIYTKLQAVYQVIGWKNEQTILDIRPDAFALISDSGIEFPVMIEIHLSYTFDFNKYANKDFSAYMGGKIPRVIICTDKTITLPSFKNVKFKAVGIEVTSHGLAVNGLESIFK
jgi:hypothetical protein